MPVSQIANDVGVNCVTALGIKEDAYLFSLHFFNLTLLAWDALFCLRGYSVVHGQLVVFSAD